MEHFGMKFVRKICRFVAAALWQLVWLVPAWVICWYAKLTLPKMIRTQFGVDQTHDRLVSLEQFVDVMKQNTSLTNPTALWQYLGAQLSKISVSVKLNTLEATSDILQSLCVWTINLLWIIALIYAVIRVFRTYRAKSQEYALAQQVARHIQPDIWALQREVMALREEIQALKQPALAVDAEKPMLPNE